MGCERYRKYVGAFADGELEVKDNLDFLEHVKMCPACAAKVDEVTTMKGALRNAYADVEPSESLRLRIVASLGEVSVDRRRNRHSEWSILIRRLVVPVAVAAALVVAVILWPTVDDLRPPPGSATLITGRVVADVRAQHAACSDRAANRHHAADLPLDIAGIGLALSQEFKLRVLAPDLRSFGFELVGADRCGVRGYPGAHVLYRALEQGPYLSIFTVARLPEIITTADRQASDLFVADDEPLAVMGWHSGAQSYLVCGDLRQKDLVALANRIRVAAADASGIARPVFARRNDE